MLAVLATFAAAAAPAPAFIDDAVDDCLEATPHAYAIPDGTTIEVRVLVLLDGVHPNRAAEFMAQARDAYAPLGLDLTVARYEKVSLEGVDAPGLIDQSRQHLGGVRPAWAHLVYTLTSKNLSSGAFGDALAGQADCIGGIAFADSAFAIGEASTEFSADTPVLVAAHELGHLLGAHHHYANCAESLVAFQNFCTLMINDVGLASLQFSSLNGAIVRGHAEEYAPPLPPVPTEAPKPKPATTSPSPDGVTAPPPRVEASTPPAAPPAAPTPAKADGCSVARSRLSAARRAEASARKRARRTGTRRDRRRLAHRREARRRAARAVARAC